MPLIAILFLIPISLVGTSKIKNKIKIKKETAICLIAGVIVISGQRLTDAEEKGGSFARPPANVHCPSGTHAGGGSQNHHQKCMTRSSPTKLPPFSSASVRRRPLITITPAIKQMAVSFLIVILFLILLVPTNEIRIKNKITIKSMLPVVLLPG